MYIRLTEVAGDYQLRLDGMAYPVTRDELDGMADYLQRTLDFLAENYDEDNEQETDGEGCYGDPDGVDGLPTLFMETSGCGVDLHIQGYCHYLSFYYMKELLRDILGELDLPIPSLYQ